MCVRAHVFVCAACVARLCACERVRDTQREARGSQESDKGTETEADGHKPQPKGHREANAHGGRSQGRQRRPGVEAEFGSRDTDSPALAGSTSSLDRIHQQHNTRIHRSLPSSVFPRSPVPGAAV